MRETVTVLVPHTAGGKWRVFEDTYEVSSEYALILAALGKVRRGKSLGTEQRAEGVNPAFVIVDEIGIPPEKSYIAPDAGDDGEAALAKARAEYTEKFGRAPHHKMKIASILDAIAAE